MQELCARVGLDATVTASCMATPSDVSELSMSSFVFVGSTRWYRVYISLKLSTDL